MTKEELFQRVENNHRYHPATENTAPLFDQVRKVTKACAQELIDLCPVSRELSFALKAMEDAMIYANAAIARNQESSNEANA